MLGKYLVPFLIPYLFRSLLDTLLKIVLFRPSIQKVSNPKKILIINWAHLGDVVMSTSVLPMIKKSYPNCEIGFLAGSWSKPILEDHVLIDRVHYLDHWKLSRSSISKFNKIINYFIMRRKTIKEIQRVEYDVAINLNYFVPSVIPIIWYANIPMRIGYTSAGYAAMLTHKYDWRDENKHVTSYYFELLRSLKIELLSDETPYYNIQFKNHVESETIKKLSIKEKYIIVHIGSGSKAKEWSINSWRKLTLKMMKLDYRLFFTGLGIYEEQNVGKVIEGLDYCENLCNNLNFKEYLELVSHASLLIGVDSLAGHLAAAYNVPSVLIYSGIANIDQWKPLASNAFILTKKIACSPCFLANGCDDMECIKSITDKDVFMTVTSLLKK